MRIKILDYNHLVHKYVNATNIERLYTIKNTIGTPQKIETTIPAYTIKEIHALCGKGENPIAVCMDSKCTTRKNYFSKNADGLTSITPYKADRKGFMSTVYEGIDLALDIMYKGGVSIYKAEDYEADDLVYSVVQQCRLEYPNVPIDVYTNDADLIPLVDEQVSVFVKNKRMTWAEDKSLERRGYWQVRPYNYSEFCEGMSSFKKFDVPYNTVLLYKLLRGDSADNIPKQLNPITGRNDYPPKVYNELIEYLCLDNVGERQNSGFILPYTTVAGEDVARNKFYSFYDAQTGFLQLDRVFKYGDALQLEGICNVLSYYLEESDIKHIKYIYNGMNLRYIALQPVGRYLPGELNKFCSEYAINLPM